MREILFRGKRRDNDEWIYGCLLNVTLYGKTANLIFGDNFLFVGKDVKALTHALVDPETVGQYTGRTDKNGKKVFEHDILQTFIIWADGTVEKCGVGIVQWWENDQCYVLTTKEGYHIEDFGNLGRPEYYEVIGNIHDNPELIGEREDND